MCLEWLQVGSQRNSLPIACSISLSQEPDLDPSLVRLSTSLLCRKHRLRDEIGRAIASAHVIHQPDAVLQLTTALHELRVLLHSQMDVYESQRLRELVEVKT
jgi:hypothetical protein